MKPQTLALPVLPVLPVLLGLVACMPKPPAESVAPAPETGPATAAPATPQVVAPAVEGATTSLAVGQVLEIALEGNASTGYAWEVVDDGAPQLVRQSVPDEAGEAVPDDAPPMVGAPGTFRWRFTATLPGEATLRLAYRRPWEEDVAPVREAVFPVEVRAAAEASH